MAEQPTSSGSAEHPVTEPVPTEPERREPAGGPAMPDPSSTGPSSTGPSSTGPSSTGPSRTSSFPAANQHWTAVGPVLADSAASASEPPPAGSGAVPAGGSATPERADQRPAETEPAAAPARPASSGRAGRNLAAAIGVGVSLGAIILVTLYLWRPGFLIIAVVAALVSISELIRAVESSQVRPPFLPLMVGGLAMLVSAWFRGTDGLTVSFLLTVLGCLVWRLADSPAGYLRDVSAGVLIAAYVPYLTGFAVLLAVPDDGARRIITFIGAVVCSDVGGYVAGVLFGKHPMAPTISPKKSWEGLAGSVVTCVVFGSLVFGLWFDDAWWKGALYGVVLAAVATVGDLGESMIKRDLGIKDMGNLLPGHGGLMDRMDSLLPSAAAAWVLLSWLVPPG